MIIDSSFSNTITYEPFRDKLKIVSKEGEVFFVNTHIFKSLGEVLEHLAKAKTVEFEFSSEVVEAFMRFVSLGKDLFLKANPSTDLILQLYHFGEMYDVESLISFTVNEIISRSKEGLKEEERETLRFLVKEYHNKALGLAEQQI